jgi:hypothetical protein
MRTLDHHRQLRAELDRRPNDGVVGIDIEIETVVDGAPRAVRLSPARRPLIHAGHVGINATSRTAVAVYRRTGSGSTTLSAINRHYHNHGGIVAFALELLLAWNGNPQRVKGITGPLWFTIDQAIAGTKSARQKTAVFKWLSGGARGPCQHPFTVRVDDLTAAVGDWLGKERNRPASQPDPDKQDQLARDRKVYKAWCDFKGDDRRASRYDFLSGPGRRFDDLNKLDLDRIIAAGNGRKRRAR